MYETFEHTADLGIRVRAANLDELFADAARGLFSVMVANLDAVRAIESVGIQLRGENLDELFHDWLAELLFHFHADRKVLADFHVQVAPPNLTAAARGETIDLGRHRIDMEVKAITWHGLRVQQQPEGWLAEAIVDI